MPDIFLLGMNMDQSLHYFSMKHESKTFMERKPNTAIISPWNIDPILALFFFVNMSSISAFFLHWTWIQNIHYFFRTQTKFFHDFPLGTQIQCYLSMSHEHRVCIISPWDMDPMHSLFVHGELTSCLKTSF